MALEFFDILEGLLPAIRRVGGYFQAQLQELARKHSFVKEVRGVRADDRAWRLEISGKQMVLDAMAEGLLINCTHDTVLRFLPPYIIKERDVDRGGEDSGPHLRAAVESEVPDLSGQVGDLSYVT